MKLGVIYDGQQNFLTELVEDWRKRFNTDIFAFQPARLPLANSKINLMLRKRALKGFLDQNDVVFFEWVGENLVEASQMPHRAAIVARLHSWELFNHAQWVRWEGVQRIILVSEAMRRKFNAMYPGHAEKTAVIPAGKPLERFSPAPHPFGGRIAMLGNIIAIKRVYEMVLALAALRQQGHDFTLHLGGKPKDGYNNQRYYASVVSAVERLGLKERVFFDGWVDAAAWLPTMDIYISNSYWEGQQNALIEAMACGCYCLSHFWDGAEEILPGENIYIGDGEMIEKITAYSRMAEAERQRQRDCLRALAAEKYDIRAALDRYRELIVQTFEDTRIRR